MKCPSASSGRGAASRSPAPSRETGAVLVQLDPTDYQIALARARADLADAEAAARAAQTGVPIASANTRSQLAGAQATLSSAQRQVEAARAQLRQAQANWTKANA